MKILFLSVFIMAATLYAGSFDYSKYDQILQNNVNNGLVNYKNLKSDRKQLTEFLNATGTVDEKDFLSWSKDERKAFWINVYNAVTIEGILRNYPIQWGRFMAKRRFPQSSIRQISKFWDTPFVKVMGKDITLNQIEHEILRKKFADPRIHFVLVCASIGCPVLDNHAFLPDNLDARLDDAAKAFILNPAKVRLDKAEKKLYLSSIFDWYKKDFKASRKAQSELTKYGDKDRGVIRFIVRYLPESDRAFILQNQPKIKYLSYDWTLNEQK